MANKTIIKNGKRYIYEGNRLVRVEDVTPKIQSQEEADKRANARKNYSGNTEKKKSEVPSAPKPSSPKIQSQAEADKRANARKNYSGNQSNTSSPEKNKNKWKLYEQTPAEKDARRSSRETDTYRRNKDEYRFAKGRRDKTANKTDTLASEVYRKYRSDSFKLDTIPSDYINLVESYENLSTKFGSSYIPKRDMAAFRQQLEDYEKRVEQLDEYVNVYRADLSEDELKAYEGISTDVKKMKAQMGVQQNIYRTYSSEADYNYKNAIDKAKTYSELVDIENQIKSDYSAKGISDGEYKKLTDKINQKMSSGEFVASMTDNQLEAERKRIAQGQMIIPGDNISYTPEGYMYFDRGKAQETTERKAEWDAKSAYLSEGISEAKAYELIKDYMNQPDFEQKSNAVMGKQTDDVSQPTENNVSKKVYDAINYGVENIAGTDAAYALAHGGGTNDFDYITLSQLAPEEKAAYNYVVNTQGLEKGMEFIEQISPVINKRYTDQKAYEAYLWGQRHPALAAVKNIATSIPEALADLGQGAIDVFAGMGGELDPYDAAHRGSSIRQSEIAGGASNFGAIGSFAYNAAITGGREALLYAATLGTGKALSLGGKALGAINMVAHSGSAFESKLLQYKKEGFSDASALISGLVSAGIEAITEALPMDRILKSPDVLKGLNTKKIVQIMKRAGVSGIEEGLEEGASMIVGDIYDIATNHEQLTAYYQAYNKAIEDGASEKDAATRAFMTALGEFGQNVLAGAFVGLGMSASNSASVVISSDRIRAGAENYFRSYGTDAETVATYLTQLGSPADIKTIDTAKTLIGFANGKSVSSEMRDSINNTPELRGVVHALVNLKSSTETDTEIPETVENVENIENPEVQNTDTDEEQTDLYNILTTGKLTSNQIDKIISDSDMALEFWMLTGVVLTGSKAEQRESVRDWAADKLNIEDMKLRKAGIEAIPLGYEHLSVYNLLKNPNSKAVGEILYNAKLLRAFEELTGKEFPKTFDGRREFIRENAELAKKVYEESANTGRGTVRQSLYRDMDALDNDESNDDLADELSNGDAEENVTSADIDDSSEVGRAEYEAAQIVADVATEDTADTIGRAGKVAYNTTMGNGKSSLVNHLLSRGYSREEATSKAAEIFSFAYESGRKGYDKNIMLGAVSDYFAKGTDIAAEAVYAFNAGVADSNLLRGKKGAKLKRNDTLRRMRSGKLSERQISERTIRAIDAIAKKLGVDIEFVDKLTDNNGNDVNASFNKKTGTLKISAKAKNHFLVAAIHESVHAIRSINPELYNKLSGIVFETLNENKSAYTGIWKETISQYRSEATNKDGSLNKDLIDEELTAKVIADVLLDEDFIKELAKTNRNFAQRIYDTIVDFFQESLNRLYSSDMTPELKDACDLLDKEFDKIATVYKAALSATERVQTEKGKATDDGGVMYSESRLTSGKDSVKIKRVGKVKYSETGLRLSSQDKNAIDLTIRSYWRRDAKDLDTYRYAYGFIKNNMYMYIYKRHDLYDYTVYARFPVKRRDDVIDRLISKEMQNGEIGISEIISTCAERIENGYSSYILYNARTGNRRTVKYAGLLSNTESASDPGRTDERSNVDKRSNGVNNKLNLKDDELYSKSSPTDLSDLDAPPLDVVPPEQLKKITAQLKADARKKIDAYVEKYGELEKGSKPARDVTLPKKTSDKSFVRRNTRTIAEAEAITDEKAAVLIEEVANDADWTTYERFGDKAAIDAAVTEFERIGYDAALTRWRAIYDSGKRITKQDIADGHLLIKEAAARRDTRTFVELTGKVAELGTMSGQVVQAMFLIKRLGPAAQIMALEKNIENAEEEINKKHHRSDFKFDVPQDLIDEYNEALLEEEKEKREAEKSGREIDNAKKKKSEKILDKIYEYMSKQAPKTLADRITTWRYFAMLGNPRTHIRNVAGNAVFMPVVMMKNIVAAIGEDAVSFIASVAGKNMERTKSIRGIASIGKHWKFAGKDAKDIEDVLKGEAKYGEHRKGKIQPKQFKLAEWNGKALEFEDWLFLKPHYQIALSMYLGTNKLNPETMSVAEFDKARTYAIKEAQKATFREASELVNEISAIKHKGLRFAFDAPLPFKKTPVNILKRGVEYSPAGLLWQLKKGFVDLRKGEINAAELIDGIAAGTTGTGILALGVYLAAQGILHGGSDDDEKTINELLGVQDYSLTIGDTNFTIDWLTPYAMPLFVGYEMYKAYQSNKEKGQPWHYMFSDFADVLPAITEPLFSMSILEGLSNIVEAGAYEETTAGKLGAIALGMPMSYLGQFVPTLFGQIARTVDNTQYQTYADKNNAIPDVLERFAVQQLKKLPWANKIPGISAMLEPSIDKKGEVRTNSEGGNIFTRALENFLSPAYINKIKSSIVDEEMQRLYNELGEGARGVLPKSLDKYVTANGERKDLSAKEYSKYQSVFGQTYYSKLKEFIGTNYYDNLSDDNKVKLLEEVKDYATEKAKSEVYSKFKADTWLKIAMETPGVYQYVIDTDAEEGFGVDDLNENQHTSFSVDRSDIVRNILEQYTPDDANYDFADKFYDYLSSFSKAVALEKNANGEYEIDTKWINEAKEMNSKKQAEFIYGKALVSDAEDVDSTSELINNDDFISPEVKMHLISDTTIIIKSPSKMYDEHKLKDVNISPETWLDVYNRYNDIEEYVGTDGKKVSKKKQVCQMIGEQPISDNAKSKLYRIWYKDKTTKGKSNIKEVTWNYVWE